MTTLEIKDLFCYGEKNIELPEGQPIFITGKNSAGKTSFARILAALVTHDANPAGLSAAHGKAYVRDGAAEGYAMMGGVTWTPPDGMTIPPDQKPQSIRHAVGLVDFLAASRSKSDRAKVWEGLFLPEDPAAILRPRWKQSQQQLQAVLDQIKSDGWDKAADIYKGQKLQFRRQWETITGVRFGEKKAAEWKPANWSVDLEGLSKDDVMTAVTEAGDALRALSVRQAVSQERIDAAEHARDTLVPEAEAKVEQLRDALRPVQETYNEAHQASAAQGEIVHKLRKAANDIKTKAQAVKTAINETKEHEPDARCPHCDGALAFEGGQVKKFVPTDIEADKKRARESLKVMKGEYDAAKAKLEEEEAKHEKLITAFETARRDVDAAKAAVQEAKGELNVHRQAAQEAGLTPDAGVDEAERSRLEKMHDEAKSRLDAWTANEQAQLALANYVEKDTVQKLLEADGARGEHMQKHMDQVRACLKSIEAKTGWLPITVSRTYECLSNGRPAVLCAENEQKKVRWALQAACAMLKQKEVQWLILDAADLLRGEHWQGLVNLVDALSSKIPGLQVVVCATESESPTGWHLIDLDA